VQTYTQQLVKTCHKLVITTTKIGNYNYYAHNGKLF